MRKSCAVGATLLLVLTSAPSAAGPSTSMSASSRVTQPHGHWRFCMETPSECLHGPDEATDPVKRDDALIGLAGRVNLDVNTQIRPGSDIDVYGIEERWAYPDGGIGDCEDYALLKKRRLARAGVPSSSLLMTVVRKRDGASHAVLTLRTDGGDFVLDNLDDVVRPWTETTYRYVKRQSVNDPKRWVAIDPPGQRQVASVGP